MLSTLFIHTKKTGISVK